MSSNSTRMWHHQPIAPAICWSISPSSGIRRNDRVVVRQRSGGLLFGTMTRRTAHKISIALPSEDNHGVDLDVRDVAWIARVVWVSQ